MKNLSKSSPLAALALILFASAAISQPAPQTLQSSPSANDPSYATLADLALAAPIVLVTTVHDAVRLKDADAAGVAPGMVRFYIEGDVDTLLAGKGGVPASVSWLADVPLVANRIPKLKKLRMILLARPTPGKPGVLQLVAKDAQLPWSQGTETRLRSILTDANAESRPPIVTGIGHAFHVAGSIPDEGETQIFLKTADNRPVSLSILRRPGEDPRWSVALGEMVDDSAAAPQKDTLLWYRLACALPSALPADAVADQSPEDAEQARADYALVLKGLGPCDRDHPAG